MAVDDATNGAYIGEAGLIPGLPFRPTKPGDVLTVYCISLGQTVPPAPPGLASPSPARTVSDPVVYLGLSRLDPANVLYAGASAGNAGLFQINIRVPELPDGDHTLRLSIANAFTPIDGFITVKK